MKPLVASWVFIVEFNKKYFGKLTQNSFWNILSRLLNKNCLSKLLRNLKNFRLGTKYSPPADLRYNVARVATSLFYIVEIRIGHDILCNFVKKNNYLFSSLFLIHQDSHIWTIQSFHVLQAHQISSQIQPHQIMAQIHHMHQNPGTGRHTIRKMTKITLVEKAQIHIEFKDSHLVSHSVTQWVTQSPSESLGHSVSHSVTQWVT